jgi:uncharacterized protein (TIGR02246 family)
VTEAERIAKQELRELVYRYARAVDRRDYALARTLFTRDAKLIGPGFDISGCDAIADSMKAIEHYRSTLHCVHNQLVELHGEQADGETYCVASHVYERDGGLRKLDWGIRYQDVYAREDGVWRFARRELLVDWTQDLPLDSAASS